MDNYRTMSAELELGQNRLEISVSALKCFCWNVKKHHTNGNEPKKREACYGFLGFK